jgi:hypothetical protein
VSFENPWLDDYLHELMLFPRGKYDDVDSTSQFLDWRSTPMRGEAVFEYERRKGLVGLRYYLRMTRVTRAMAQTVAANSATLIAIRSAFSRPKARAISTGAKTISAAPIVTPAAAVRTYSRIASIRSCNSCGFMPPSLLKRQRCRNTFNRRRGLKAVAEGGFGPAAADPGIASASSL